MSPDGLVKVLLLAVVQGIAEFLPVSSSGHLVVLDQLYQRFFPTDGPELENVVLTITLHLGTLAAILVVYRRDLCEIWRKPRLCLAIVVASIPAAVVGLLFKEQIEATFKKPLVVACGWVVTAALLHFGQRLGRNTRPLEELRLVDAVVIGCFQALSACFRGVSRSGSTISGGLFMGLRREAAAAFSFLIAIPVTGGAALLKARPLIKLLFVHLHLLSAEKGPTTAEVSEMLGGYSPLVLVIGAATSFVVGLLALRWLLRIINQRGLNWFVWYCLVVAALTFAWQGYECLARP